MRAIIQRVSKASVESDNDKRSIERGLVILIGVEVNDTESDSNYIVDKTTNLRIFDSVSGNFNWSAKQLGLDVLVVSNFTLMAETKKGRRLSFNQAAPSEFAGSIFANTINRFKETKLNIVSGYFGQAMSLEIHNDGPVTLIIDSKETRL